MADTVPTGSREIRGSSIVWIAMGMLLIYGSLQSGTGSAPLTVRYQLNYALALVGMAMVIFGFVHLYRRKGDPDDFEDSGQPKVR